MAFLFVIGFLSLFVWTPLGVILLLVCFFGLLFRIADNYNPEEAAKAARKAKEQEQADGLTNLRSAVKALEAKAKAEGEGTPAALAHQQVAAELEREEVLAAERHRRKDEHDSRAAAMERQASTERFWIWSALIFIIIFLIVLANL